MKIKAVRCVTALFGGHGPASHWWEMRLCPRRYLAVLPSHSRPNLFVGD